MLAASFTDGVLTFSLECFLQLYSPLELGPIHLEHGDPHDKDNDRRDQREYP